MKGADLFFNFGNFDEEIEKKIRSRHVPSDLLMEGLLDKLKGKKVSAETIQKIKPLYEDFLRDSSLNKEKAEYLSHPIRMAASYIEYLENPSYDDLALALCHNLKEKLGGEYQKVGESFVPVKIKRSIETLTIDREREKDKNYLKEFYDGIEQAGNNLLLLKALDKLDNAFIWVFLDLEPYHSEIVLEFVCPRIEKKYPELAGYLKNVTHYVLTQKAKTKFRRIKEILELSSPAES